MVDEVSNLENTSSRSRYGKYQFNSDLIDNTAKNSFGTFRPTKLNKSVHRPWFDEICNHKRQEFHSARKIYNRFKSETNRIRLSEASKDYKFTMNKSFEKYQNKIACNIRKSAKSDHKKYGVY